MSALAARHFISNSELEQLREARAIVRQEALALTELSDRLGTSFTDAVRLMNDCTGSVAVCGIGKAGLIGQKIAATLSSTGLSPGSTRGSPNTASLALFESSRVVSSSGGLVGRATSLPRRTMYRCRASGPAD